MCVFRGGAAIAPGQVPPGPLTINRGLPERSLIEIVQGVSENDLRFVSLELDISNNCSSCPSYLGLVPAVPACLEKMNQLASTIVGKNAERDGLVSTSRCEQLVDPERGPVPFRVLSDNCGCKLVHLFQTGWDGRD